MLLRAHAWKRGAASSPDAGLPKEKPPERLSSLANDSAWREREREEGYTAIVWREGEDIVSMRTV